MDETVAQATLHERDMLGLLPFSDMSLQRLAQHTTLMITLAIEVYVEYGILQPLFFEIHDLKTLKEVAATFEIGFQSADEQALSETARPAEEESTSLSQPIYQVGLIHIDVAALADLLKTLYAYRILHPFNSSFHLTKCQTLCDLWMSFSSIYEGRMVIIVQE